MKRLLSLLVVAALLVAGLSIAAPATAVDLPETELYTLFTGTLSADKSTLTIEANFLKNPGVWAYQTLLYYNADALRLESVEDGEVFDGAMHQFFDEIASNPYTYYAQNRDLDKNITGTGLVATYVFKVLDTSLAFNISVVAPAKCTIGIDEQTYDPIVYDTANAVEYNGPQSADGTTVNVTIDGVTEAYSAGSEVELTAAMAVKGAFYVENRYAYRFDHWTSSVEGCIADPTSLNTTLTVPDTDVEITALYHLVGDVNGDGVIDSSDVIRESRILAGSEKEVAAADIDGDGSVNTADLVAMRRYIVGAYVPSK